VTRWSPTRRHAPARGVAEKRVGRPGWTADQIIEAMIAWNHQHGRPPRRRDWTGGGASHPAGNTVYRVFGCWSAALVAAGFDASPPGPPRRPGGWDPDSVIEWTDRCEAPRLVDWSPSLARRHGCDQAADLFEAERPRYPLASRVVRLFGTWNGALRAAGQPTTQTGLRRSAARPSVAPRQAHSAPWTRQEVIDAIQAHAREHGRPPVYDAWAVGDPTGGRPSVATVFAIFWILAGGGAGSGIEAA